MNVYKIIVRHDPKTKNIIYELMEEWEFKTIIISKDFEEFITKLTKFLREIKGL